MGQNTTPSPPQSYYPGHASPQTPLPRTSRPQATTPTSTSVSCALRNSLSTHPPACAPPSPQGLRTFLVLACQTPHLQASEAVLRAATLDSVRRRHRRSRPRTPTWTCSAWVLAEPLARALTRNTVRLLDRPPWHTGRYVDLIIPNRIRVVLFGMQVQVSLSQHLDTQKRDHGRWMKVCEARSALVCGAMRARDLSRNHSSTWSHTGAKRGVATQARACPAHAHTPLHTHIHVAIP